MSKLTAKQEAFCQAIADGKTQADAYRTAYSAGSMKAETVQKRASELMGNGVVAGRVAELKDALAEKALWTRTDSVDVLKEIAQSGGSPEAARVSSIKELNAMHGFNQPAKVDLTSSDGSMSPAANSAAIIEALNRKHSVAR